MGWGCPVSDADRLDAWRFLAVFCRLPKYRGELFRIEFSTRLPFGHALNIDKASIVVINDPLGCYEDIESPLDDIEREANLLRNIIGG